MGVIFNIEGLTKKFGGLVALDNVNFELNEGELKAVIGPNGAGKTTLFNIITGIYPPTSGKIYFMNEEITNLKPYEICRKGIARTYQITSLFQNLTVQENIRLAVQVGYGKHINFFKKALELKEVINKVEEILELMDLEDKANVAVSNMSHGDQRLLEVAIALGSNPKILLLDEPTAGMSIKETKDMTNKLKELFSTGKIKNIIIIEHDMEVVTELAEKICVLNYGKVIKDGTVEEVKNDPLVQEIYLKGGRQDAKG
ncbi:MAG: ABC transporter ATP-binding protein [Spirochaetes bacterium]|nr:ABC transporter ATP-binding protein [Deltaproteobacteria bacterium]RKY02957.1 MAG: ABC transporter ATP-binding protein [Spirochaetota bacterium]